MHDLDVHYAPHYALHQIRCILILWISSDAAVPASMQFIGIEDRESSYEFGQESKSRDERNVHNATFQCL